MTRARRVADALLAWYRERERNVPWRGESDPYRIWVGEVMAQQTRMDTVLERYPAFLSRFPDVRALAEAERDVVLKAWEGLGYYARARNLHRAARQVVERHGGSLPADRDALRELPGVGAYTAGAVASLAFGRVEPAVDGNARRVLSRLDDIAEPTAAALEKSARRLVEARPDMAAAVNQALMDLGGDVCTPQARIPARTPDPSAPGTTASGGKSRTAGEPAGAASSAGPACHVCPVTADCLARARGTISERPPPRRRGSIPHHPVAVGLVWREGRVLVQRRPEEGLLGGLWEFPGGKVEPGESPPQAVRRELLEETGLRVRVVRPVTEPISHAYSHFRITLHAYHAHHLEGEPRPRAATDWRWAAPERLEELAFPAANRRILEALAGP